MKKWYWGTSLAQKVFMFLVAMVSGLFGLSAQPLGNESPTALQVVGTVVGLIPLVLLIFLALGGRPKKTEADS
jgi:hypothetical protein